MKNELIKQYCYSFFTLIPLEGKVPTERNWVNAPYRSELTEADFSGNYGVVLKDTDLVIDYDIARDPMRDTEQSALKILSRMAVIDKNTFMVNTGGGGWHIYLSKPVDFPVKGSVSFLKGVEFKTKGQQVVGAYSIHPITKRVYKPLTNEIKIQPASKDLLDLIKKDEVSPNAGKDLPYDDSVFPQLQFLSWVGFMIKKEGFPTVGSRNTRLFSIASYGKDYGLPEECTYELLQKFYNPLHDLPIEDSELRATISHAYKYSKNYVGCRLEGANNANRG